MRHLALATLLLAGCPPGVKEDTAVTPSSSATFTATVATEIDVLWVIDDSVSMLEEQEQLGRLAPALFTGWGSANVHIGTTTTSLAGDPEDAVVTWEALDCAGACLDAFSAGLRPGNEGSDQERGLEVAWTALAPPLADTVNAGFARPGSLRMIVVVSDEEDCSGVTGTTGEDCYVDGTAPPVGELVAALWDLDADARVQVSGVVGFPGAAACSPVVPGRRYLEAIGMTGGYAHDICMLIDDAAVQAIHAAALAPAAQFRLSEPIDPDTASVTVDGAAVARDDEDGWSWDETTWILAFHGAARPAEGAVVTITYAPI